MQYALKHIYRFLPVVYNLTVNTEDAEDLVHDLAVKIIENSAYFPDKESEQFSFALRMLKNIFLNSLINKKLKKNRHCGMMPVHDVMNDADSGYLGVQHEDAIDKTALAELLVKMNELGKEQRNAVLMSAEGYKAREISALTGRKLNTVLTDIRKGRIKLRQLYTEQ